MALPLSCASDRVGNCAGLQPRLCRFDPGLALHVRIVQRLVHNLAKVEMRVRFPLRTPSSGGVTVYLVTLSR